MKLDAPSGTALALADSVNEALNNEYEYVFDRSQRREKRPDKEIGISAVRGGTIVGDHDVIFAGTDEVITFEAVKAAAVPLLYAGIFSCSFAYTFQIVGQQHTTPTAASLLLSTESVFAAIAAWVLIGDTMTAREIIGGLLSFFAVILSQLPSKQNTANV